MFCYVVVHGMNGCSLNGLGQAFTIGSTMDACCKAFMFNQVEIVMLDQVADCLVLQQTAAQSSEIKLLEA